MDLTTAQLDRACGVLLGTAAGDALGAGYEFGPPLPPQAPVTMKGGGSLGWEPGEWTDDTSMALVIAETAAVGRDLRSVLAQDLIAARWAEWARDARDVGIQTGEVLEAVRRGTAAEALAASREQHERTGHTAGNGSLMRTAPVALAFLDDPEGLTQAATALSALTHYAPSAGQACVLWCHAIRHAVLTGELDARIGLDWLPKPSRDGWAELLNEAERARTRHFARNGWVVEALQAAWCAIATTPVPPDKPAAGQFRAGHLRLALEEAVRGGRDADTVAAIAGGLLGAAYGASAVPASWRLALHGWPGLKARDLVALAATIATRTALAAPVYGGGHRPPVTVPHPLDPGLLLADVAAAGTLPAEVTAVVSLCPAGPREQESILARTPRWLEVRLADDDDPAENQNLDFVLHDTVTAIEELRAAGHVVLVHCVAAHSRTPTIGALYAMRRAGLSPGQAIAAMELALPEVDPADAFRDALQRAQPS
ncbi:MAG TPA: ADP-ribosylglycohydrolase family protein [Trebonia sp.]|nr:ADP-ribosylglycohydrolase family protein [Trebonia sp.]